jgi:uncharacterized protein (TIGR02145 family)
MNMKSKLFRRPTALSPEGHLSSRVAALSAAKQPLSRAAASSRAAALSALLLLFALPAAAQDFDLTVCRGQSFMLTCPAEGADGLGPITYEWYYIIDPTLYPDFAALYPDGLLPIDDLFSIDTNSATLTIPENYVGAGTYAAVCVVANSACTLSSNSYTLKVLPRPAPPLMNIPSWEINKCQGTGDFVLWATSPQPGATYVWSGVGTLSGTVSGTGNTSYTISSATVGQTRVSLSAEVRMENGLTCRSETRDTTFTVHPSPAAPIFASASARCGAGTVTFSATAPNGNTIDWYTAASGGSTVSGGYGVTSFSPFLTSTTSYYAQARNTTTGCVSASRTQVTGTVNPVPDITRSGGEASQSVNRYFDINTIVYSAPNSTFALSGSLPDGVNGNASANSYTITGAPSATGTYNYTVTATYSPGGCTATSSGTITVTFAPANCHPDANAMPVVCAVVGSQEWSGPRRVAPAGCTLTTNMQYATENIAAYYRSEGVYEGSGYLYNWKCVDDYESTFCPSPWRVPTIDDFCDLKKELIPRVTSCGDIYEVPKSEIADTYETVWGCVYGGSAEGTAIRDIGAIYWSSTEDSSAYAQSLFLQLSQDYINVILVRSAQTHGFQVRCVK